MSAEADAILEEAYRILSEEKEWCQGQMHRPLYADLADAYAVCLSGALTLAVLRFETRDGLTEADRRICAAIGVSPSDDGFAPGVCWNDDPHTTKEDVLLALKRARYDFGDAS